MLDPLTALSLASNIVQLLEITGQVVSQTHGFLQSSSDALPSNEAFLKLATDNQRLAREITSSIDTQQHPLGRHETTAKDAAIQCSLDATRLLAEMKTLQVKKHSSKVITGMRAVGQSIRTVTKRRTLENLQNTLQARETQLATALLQLISHNQDADFEELKSWMQKHDVYIGNTLLPVVGEIKQVIDAQQQKCLEHSNLIQDGFDRIEARHDKLGSTMDRELYERKTRLIIESLRYADMDYRRHVILDSHGSTFEWCFDNNVSQLQAWLERECGIFWICGKAGSGKSTFMKFLCNDDRTRKALRTWSNTGTLIFVEHYFWYAGTALQKSHQGLLQSILYQILSSTRSEDLVSILCADRWAGHKKLDAYWTRAELVRAIHCVHKCNHIKICIFIDGLDEYYPQDQHDLLISELLMLANISNLKLCVSSRPWTAFIEAFGKLPNHIRLEDLTHADVTKYVRDHLQTAASANYSSRALSKSDQEDLVRYVVDKAQGVFLWVYLVVSALVERMTAGNSLERLIRCVADFPDELEDFFRRSIYDRIHKTWRNDSAKALKLGLLLSREREIINTDNHPRGYIESFLPFWLLQEGIDGPDFATSMAVKHVTTLEVCEMIDSTKKHLNACCKDLLCIREYDNTKWAVHSRQIRTNIICSYRVEFLHRSVYDFLRSDEMTQLLDQNVPAIFIDDEFLLNMCVACTKVIIQEYGTDEPNPRGSGEVDQCLQFIETISFLLRETSLQSVAKRSVYHSIMKDIDNVGSQHATSTCNHSCWSNPSLEVQKAYIELLQRLIACHLYSYPTAVIPDASWSAQTSVSILLAAMGLWTRHTFPIGEISPGFIGFVLGHGTNPNLEIRSLWQSWVRPSDNGTWCVGLARYGTVWSCFLRKWLQECRAQEGVETPSDIECQISKRIGWAVATEFLSHGADLEQRIWEEDTSRLTLSINSSTFYTAAQALKICVASQDQAKLDEILDTFASIRRDTT